MLGGEPNAELLKCLQPSPSVLYYYLGTVKPPVPLVVRSFVYPTHRAQDSIR